jgi:hypothetical protein
MIEGQGSIMNPSFQTIQQDFSHGTFYFLSSRLKEGDREVLPAELAWRFID